MATQSTVGRPRKFTEAPVYFGMKITADEQQMIKELANYYQKPATTVIIKLVKEQCMRKNLNNLKAEKEKKIGIQELRKLSPAKRKAIIEKSNKAYMKCFEYIDDDYSTID